MCSADPSTALSHHAAFYCSLAPLQISFFYKARQTQRIFCSHQSHFIHKHRYHHCLTTVGAKRKRLPLNVLRNNILTFCIVFLYHHPSVSHGHSGAVAPRWLPEQQLLSGGLPVTELQARWEERLTWWPGRVDGKRRALCRPPAPATARTQAAEVLHGEP